VTGGLRSGSAHHPTVPLYCCPDGKETPHAARSRTRGVTGAFASVDSLALLQDLVDLGLMALTKRGPSCRAFILNPKTKCTRTTEHCRINRFAYSAHLSCSLLVVARVNRPCPVLHETQLAAAFLPVETALAPHSAAGDEHRRYSMRRRGQRTVAHR
jgi:hypothetical protein